MRQLPKPTLLRKLRKRSGLTQEELAFVIGVSDGQMSRYELGDQPPSGTVIVGSHIVFGAWADIAFVDFYQVREAAVLSNVRYLERHLVRRSDPRVDEKVMFLREILTKHGRINTNGT